jgi:hypothetical protein
MQNAIDADDFLGEFMRRGIPNHDEVGGRQLNECDFGAGLDNEENDVPLYDQYNRGLVATQEDRPRLNLALEGNQCPPNAQQETSRPGITGYIPSVEEGLETGAIPLAKGAVLVDLNQAPRKSRQLR